MALPGIREGGRRSDKKVANLGKPVGETRVRLVSKPGLATGTLKERAPFLLRDAIWLAPFSFSHHRRPKPFYTRNSLPGSLKMAEGRHFRRHLRLKKLKSGPFGVSQSRVLEAALVGVARSGPRTPCPPTKG